MKNLLFIFLLFGLKAASQTAFPLYLPGSSNTDSIKQTVNVNGSPRQVYNIDLVKYRAALTARDTAAALRLLISGNTSAIATNTINISANTTAIGLKTNLGWFNVTDYGAVGDGTTDNTTSINNAITAASAVSGTVYIPKGTWIVKSAYQNGDTYQPTGIHLASNVTIVGDGIDKTIIKLSAPPTGVTYSSTGTGTNVIATTNGKFSNIMWGNGVSNCIIRDLTVNGNLASQKNWSGSAYNAPWYTIANGTTLETQGILFWNGSNNTVRNVKVMGAVDRGIEFRFSDYATAENCTVSGNGVGGIGLWGLKYGKVYKCFSTDNYADGILVVAGSSYCTVSECISTAAKINAIAQAGVSANYAGIYVEKSSYIRVTNNICRNNSSYGIDVWDQDTAGMIGLYIAGNTISYNANGGVRFLYDYSTIEGNTIYNNRKDESGNVDNTINSPYGIVIGSSNFNVFRNNTFYDDRGFQTYSFGFESTNTNNTFINNNSYGGTAFFSSTPSAPNIVSGNNSFGLAPVSSGTTITFPTVNHLAETSTGSGIWQPSGATATSAYGNTGLSALSLPANTTGRIYSTATTGSGNNNSYVLGLKTTNALGAYATFNYGVNVDGTGNIGYVDGGVFTANLSTISTQTYLGLYRDGTTGVVKLQKSTDAVTWTDLRTFPTTTTAALYILTDIFWNSTTANSGKLAFPKGEGIQ